VLQTAGRLLAPQLEAEAISIRLELAASLPPVLADSNQILHVCIHLAGQISAHLNRETHSTLFVRTHGQGNVVLVDFTSYDPSADPSSQPLSFPCVFNSAGGNKPSSLSLSACCRIVEEHGGRLLQPATPGNPAFRMELQVATSSASRSSFAAPNRAAAGSNS
jgi:nitrogen-specific signal transduction histidine kinase